MRKQFKRILFIILSVSLLVSGVPLVSADTHISTYYSEGVYKHHIKGAIKPGSLRQIILSLQFAQKGDIVKIWIDSVGGRVLETSKLLTAMRLSKAITVCYGLR